MRLFASFIISGIAVLSALNTSRAEAAPVTWDMVETSCTSVDGGCTTGKSAASHRQCSGSGTTPAARRTLLKVVTSTFSSTTIGR